MSTEQKLKLTVLIAKSRRIAAELKAEVDMLMELCLEEEALAKERLRMTHLRRCLRYTNRLIQHEA